MPLGPIAGNMNEVVLTGKPVDRPVSWAGPSGVELACHISEFRPTRVSVLARMPCVDKSSIPVVSPHWPWPPPGLTATLSGRPSGNVTSRTGGRSSAVCAVFLPFGREVPGPATWLPQTDPGRASVFRLKGPYRPLTGASSRASIEPVQREVRSATITRIQHTPETAGKININVGGKYQ